LKKYFWLPLGIEAVTKLATPDRETIDSRLDEARKDRLATLDVLRTGTLSDMEADAVAAAIEDELIALRVSLLRGR
jgi:hypothetical protein